MIPVDQELQAPIVRRRRSPAILGLVSPRFGVDTTLYGSFSAFGHGPPQDLVGAHESVRWTLTIYADIHCTPASACYGAKNTDKANKKRAVYTMLWISSRQSQPWFGCAVLQVRWRGLPIHSGGARTSVGQQRQRPACVSLCRENVDVHLVLGLLVNHSSTLLSPTRQHTPTNQAASCMGGT
jgi:hypothetical protein